MKHTLFRISVWDDEKIVAMARMNGDLGLDYNIKDVVVRPEYFVELCAVPDKIPFYEKFGFEANEAQRLKLFHRVE